MDGSTVTRIVALAGLVYLCAIGGLALRARRPILAFAAWEHPLGAAGVALLLVANGLGLFWAPADVFMGPPTRILYVHVPDAWVTLLLFAVATPCALLSLFTGRRAWDSAVEATLEVGMVQGALLIVLGAVFARPTWGVWWTWDARLTTTAILMVSFLGVALLRSVVRDPDRRATWSAVATIVASLNVPLTYLSVKWRSIHAVASETMEGSTIDPAMRWVLFLNTWALLFVTIWFVVRRWRLSESRADAEVPEPLPTA